MAEDKGVGEGEKKESGTTPPTTTTMNEIGKKKRKGIFSRIWNGIFGTHCDDFEKRLQYISNEEAVVLARIKRRSQTWRRMIRHLIIVSVIFEVIAVAFAIVATRTVDMNWKVRAFRVLPIFLLPAISSITYSAFVSFSKICDRKDQKTLESLRAERRAKIDELKERTNYYTTQQLIERYDPDPAAKAAAATVLASKLGADSGLKVFWGDEHNVQALVGKSNDVEFVQSGGLRNRKQPYTQLCSAGSSSLLCSGEGTPLSLGCEEPQTSEQNPLVVSHYNPQGPPPQDGGWFARIAAMLVGEDPTQSYALICGNCHVHNGLARKEDFPFITYYCPHCQTLNRPHQSEDHISGSSTPNAGSIKGMGSRDVSTTASVPASESAVTGDRSIKAISENKIEEMIETTWDLAS